MRPLPALMEDHPVDWCSVVAKVYGAFLLIASERASSRSRELQNGRTERTISRNAFSAEPGWWKWRYVPSRLILLVSLFFLFLSLLSEAGTKWVLWLYLGVSEHLEDRVCGGMGDSPGRSCYTPVAAEPNSQPRWLYGNDPTAWFC